MRKKIVIHDYYLTDADSDDRMGFKVKRVSGKGVVITESWIPVENLDWFWNKDFLVVSREDYEYIGSEVWMNRVSGV
jgi:hypothetical protein